MKEEADRRDYVTKRRKIRDAITGGQPFSRGHLYHLLHNPLYVGEVAHKGKTYPGQHQAIVERTTWDAVKLSLDDQAPARRTPSNTPQGSLLTGLVFDEHREPLSPSFCRKNGRRYRYYISKKLMHDTDKDGGWRIPANQLEEAVLKELSLFLSDGPKVATTVHAAAANPKQVQASAQAAAHLAAEIHQGRIDDVTGPVRKIVDRVVLAASRLRIYVSPTGLATAIGEVATNGDAPIVLDAPMTIRRRGVESKIILQGTSKTSVQDGGLIGLVGEAHQWFASIASGKHSTVREIAREAEVDEGDVSRFLPLAFLAPDIVEAILSGKQPVELTAEKLKRLRSLPKSWEEQRQSLGFAD